MSYAKFISSYTDDALAKTLKGRLTMRANPVLTSDHNESHIASLEAEIERRKTVESIQSYRAELAAMTLEELTAEAEHQKAATASGNGNVKLALVLGEFNRRTTKQVNAAVFDFLVDGTLAEFNHQLSTKMNPHYQPKHQKKISFFSRLFKKAA